MLAALLVSFGFISTAAMTDRIFLEPDKTTHKYPGQLSRKTPAKRVRINAGRVGSAERARWWSCRSSACTGEPADGALAAWCSSSPRKLVCCTPPMFAGDSLCVPLLLLLAPGLLYLLWSGALNQVNPCAHQPLSFTITQ